MVDKPLRSQHAIHQIEQYGNKTVYLSHHKRYLEHKAN